MPHWLVWLAWCWRRSLIPSHYFHPDFPLVGVKGVNFGYVTIHVTSTYEEAFPVVLSWQLCNWQKVIIRMELDMAYAARWLGVHHSLHVSCWAYMPSSVLIPSEMGLYIDRGAVPICCWRQILSHGQFCNLICATPFHVAEVDDFDPQCHQALFLFWMKVGREIKTGYEARGDKP